MHRECLLLCVCLMCAFLKPFHALANTDERLQDANTVEAYLSQQFADAKSQDARTEQDLLDEVPFMFCSGRCWAWCGACWPSS